MLNSSEQPGRQDGDTTGTPSVLGGSERQFRLLVQGVTDYAIYMLDPSGTIASWNAGGERIKGWSSDEIIGQHFSRFYTDADRDAGEPAVALETARTQGRYEKEGWRLRRDGTRFWANVIIDPVHDDDGRLIGYAKITRDISERREQQRAIEVAQQAMLQAHRMEAIGQLTYGVAHDFNNLLTVITNSLDLMAADATDPQRIRRLVAGAQRAAERGSLLTRQLLAYSRRQTLRPQVHDINSLIYAAESVLRRAVGEDTTIELNLGRGIGEVNVDGAEFEAALLNLVVNARDAMPGGGYITIRTREVAQRVGEGRREPGRYALVTVEDSGTGMEPEVIEHAMEPFFTTKEVGKGSGLGLSQVYGFAAQSGGDVTIESSVGQGTTISFYLPIRSEAAQLGEGDSGDPVKVLLVEDDPDVQLMAIETLRYLGYAVLTADEGLAALEVLRRDPEVGILFTDIVMPKGMSGVDLMHEAKKLRPGLKVLLASGYARGQLPTIPEGADFIAKPYRVDELRDRLKALAERGAS